MKQEDVRYLLIENGFTEKQISKVLKSIRTLEFKDVNELLHYVYDFFGPYQTSVDMIYNAFIYHTNFKPVASILLDDYLNRNVDVVPNLYTTYKQAKEIACKFLQQLVLLHSMDFFGVNISEHDDILNDDDFKYLLGIHYYYYRTMRLTPINTLMKVQTIIEQLSKKYHNLAFSYKDFIKYTKDEFLDYIKDCDFQALIYCNNQFGLLKDRHILSKKEEKPIISETDIKNVPIQKFHIDEIPYSFIEALGDYVYVLYRLHNC